MEEEEEEGGEKKEGEFRGGDGGGGEGGEWGSNLSSVQLQKLLLPTITTMIQKFV